jgi:hypothetical protein
MQKLITMAALLTLLGSPVASAQTIGRSAAGPARPTVSLSLMQDTRLVGSAPVGHRQPHASDVPSENPNDLEHIMAEDAAVDRKLNICRGC